MNEELIERLRVWLDAPVVEPPRTSWLRRFLCRHVYKTVGLQRVCRKCTKVSA
jgi:hypothetical protein